jgi:hypothetical protein
MRNIAVVFIAVVALLIFSAPAQARDAFAGTWNVTVTPDESAKGEKQFKDTLTFKGNQFKSKTLDARGYKEADYEEDTRSGLVATFKSTSKSEKEGGTAIWSGTSTGQDITGELTVTSKDGKETKYTFKGAKEPK